MKIVVLCGGVSTERDVSLKTSSRVAGALRSRGHEVVMIDVFFGAEKVPDFSAEQDFQKLEEELRLRKKEITKERIQRTGLMGPYVFETCKAGDVVFIGLHGENGEDGKVQAVLEEAGIPFTGSDSKSSALAMSKSVTKEIVSAHITMPKGITLRREDGPFDAKTLPIRPPCVLKPSNGGSSLGVLLVNSDADYDEAIRYVFQFDDTILIEEFIKGRELTQGVLDGAALPPVEICPDEGTWYDYENKYNGKTVELCPAPISDEVLKEMSETSIRFGELLGLSVYYRIDYQLQEDGTLFALEANSLPGMTATSLVPQEAKAIGMEYPDLCERIVEISLAERKKEKNA